MPRARSGAADDADADRARRAVAAVWRIESARIVATLTRFVGDVGQAEDLAQEALLEALRQWPAEGVPHNPGAWLTAVAKRRAIDGWRRRERLDERYAAMAHDLEQRRRRGIRHVLGPRHDRRRRPAPDLRRRATRCSRARRRSR